MLTAPSGPRPEAPGAETVSHSSARPPTEAPPRAGLDAWLLLGSRAFRMLGVGVMVVTLPLYLARLGLGAVEVGAVLTCGMAGGAVATLAFGGPPASSAAGWRSR